MSYLDAATRAALIADPAIIQSLYNSNWYRFALDLGPADAGLWMPNELLASAYASIVANDLKPYGPEPGIGGYEMADLLASPSLACDGFVALTWRFMKLLDQCANVKTRAVGWDNGPETNDPACPVGNHAQMFVGWGGTWLLLDPTIGLVAQATYRDVAAGVPVNMATSKCFSTQYQNDPVKTPFAATVQNALSSGSYRPCHALYFCGSFSIFADPEPIAEWPTPSAARFQV